MVYSSIYRIFLVILALLACACMISGCGQVHPADEYLIEAEALYKQHKPRQAKAQIDLAIKVDPFRNETYDGASLVLINDIPEAERVYMKGFSLDPENAGFLNGLGYLYADKGINLKKALELTRKAVDIQPDNGSFVDSLGWAQYKIGDYTSAIHTLQRATALEPDSAEVRYHLGAAYAKVDRLQEAQIELQKALVLNPSLTDAVNLYNKLRK
ncbi:MAG: tetratricopeptide repeat protein [Armatimonadetes bacterium]|nr:tetratricopeptide repeat protein [Armatimonadota bacterium]